MTDSRPDPTADADRDPDAPRGREADTNRLEAFSDGVFAIAITLLILEIKVPEIHAEGGLGESLIRLWPSYAGYVISFLTIGIMWLNHHGIFRLLARGDHDLRVWNLLLLLSISFVPFSTAVLAEFLKPEAAAADLNVAVAFYCGTFAMNAVMFNGLWWHIRRAGLLRPDAAAAVTSGVDRAYLLGPVTYIGATLLALVLPVVSLLIAAGMAILYTLPSRGANAAT